MSNKKYQFYGLLRAVLQSGHLKVTEPMQQLLEKVFNPLTPSADTEAILREHLKVHPKDGLLLSLPWDTLAMLLEIPEDEKDFVKVPGINLTIGLDSHATDTFVVMSPYVKFTLAGDGDKPFRCNVKMELEVENPLDGLEQFVITALTNNTVLQTFLQGTITKQKLQKQVGVEALAMVLSQGNVDDKIQALCEKYKIAAVDVVAEVRDLFTRLRDKLMTKQHATKAVALEIVFATTTEGVEFTVSYAIETTEREVPVAEPVAGATA